MVDGAPYDGGQAFDGCEFVNTCDPGLMCYDTASVSTGCNPGSLGCCTPFCDTSLANTCPGPAQTCVAVYPEGEAPAGLEHVGICQVPQTEIEGSTGEGGYTTG